MNKYLFLVFSLLMFVFACSTDDTTNQTNYDSINNIWEISDIVGSITATYNVSGQETFLYGDIEGSNSTLKIDLRQDNTFTSSGDFDLTLYLDFQGQTNAQTTNIDNIFGSGTWEFNEESKTLLLTNNDTTSEIIMTEFTYERMVGNFNYSLGAFSFGTENEIEFQFTFTR